MKIDKKIILATGAALAATATISSAAMAATSTNTQAGNKDSLVQAIADKFHLNKSDVQQVFETYRSQHHQDRQQHIKDRLDQAVKDGKLTQDQENKLLAEINTLEQQKQSTSQTDRHANRQAFHDQLEQWAKDNGIDLSQILPGPPIHTETN